ncbi:MAG: hypothetical protein L6Q37_03725, partial [Bdellovibrionaceae bacterium]|nr:hypothetical protein [Pseudobdellovibrionaceae bacterium]
SAGKGANGNNAGGSQGSAASHGAGAGKDPLKVNSGSYGGTQGGSFGAGYFGKTSSGGGTNGALPPTTGRRDIAKFDPRKYITGLGGKAEYINMSSENIFKIVKMRYEGKKSTLLPEDYNIKK